MFGLTPGYALSQLSGMSGGSPGSNYGGGNGDDTPSCETLVVRTFLSSPDPSVIRSLKVGDVLTVTLQQQSDVDMLLAVDSFGKVSGSLVPRYFAKFVSCIRDGTNYVAVVQDLNGGQVLVEIRPAAQD